MAHGLAGGKACQETILTDYLAVRLAFKKDVPWNFGLVLNISNRTNYQFSAKWQQHPI
jgi:hypothetical protein